jgi:hypothetical protein
MNIAGQLGAYECQYERHGWTYCKAVVFTLSKHTYRSFFGIGPIKTKLIKKRVWTSERSQDYEGVARWHPKQLREWYTREVDQYEAYAAAWNKEFDTAAIVVDNPVPPNNRRIR